MDETKRESLIAAKAMLAAARTATLSVIDPETQGPFGALVNIAVDEELRPIILTSTLSRHTQGLLKDGRASIVVQGVIPEDRDPLTEMRLTVTGSFTASEDQSARACYLNRHPYAELYVDFGDFGFWHMVPEKMFVVAGFGRVYSFDMKDVRATA
jgi:putative heme iron utilization protein